MQSQTLSYCVCLVTLLTPPTHTHSLLAPSSPHSAAAHQHGCYLFTHYLLLLHSSTGWIMAIFPRVKPYCNAHILEISICYQGRVTEIPDQRVHTAPQRTRTATAEDRPERLDERTELSRRNSEMERGSRSPVGNENGEKSHLCF